MIFSGRMELTCNDDKMRQILLNIGIAENKEEANSMLKDKSKRKRIDSIIEMQGGIEKIYSVTQKRKLSVSGPVPGSFIKNTGTTDPFRINQGLGKNINLYTCN